MVPQLHECPQCRAPLPVEEFRMLRGWPKRRAKICELCEVENRHRMIRRRRKRRKDEEAARLELYRNVSVD